MNYIVPLQKVSRVVSVSLGNSTLTHRPKRSIQRADTLLWSPLNELIKTRSLIILTFDHKIQLNNQKITRLMYNIKESFVFRSTGVPGYRIECLYIHHMSAVEQTLCDFYLFGFVKPKDGTDMLSRNIAKKLQPPAV